MHWVYIMKLGLHQVLKFVIRFCILSARSSALENLTRGLEPDVWTYNALIAALFKEGMWKQAQAIFLEMIDRGIKAYVSTFKVLLAGYCKARQFEEVKATIREMANLGLIKLSLSEDPLCKAFEVLHINPLTTRIRRDNHAGLSLAEFYDNLGNGLYLQTDEDDFELKITEVLEESITLDFNILIMNEMSNGSLKKSLALANQAFQWGQEVSSSTLTCLIREVRESGCHIKSIISLLEKMPQLYKQLDHETLNWLLQVYSKKGLTYQGGLVFEIMLLRHLSFSDITCSAFLMCICKKGNIEAFQICWRSARTGGWLPNIKDVEPLVDYLLQHKMLNEALELHKSLVEAHPHMSSDINHIFVHELCALGYTGVVHVWVRRVQNEGHIMDQTAYDNLIEGFFQEKQISDALRIYDEMLALNVHPSLTVSVLVIPHLCKTNQFDKVMSLKDLCLQRYPSELLVIYKALILSLSKTGKIAVILRSMMMDGVSPDTEIFNLLIRDRCQMDDLEKALELFGVMIRQNASFEIPSYGNLVKLLCLRGNVRWALNLRVFMLLETESPILTISNILLFYLFKTRNGCYVEKILCELQEKGISIDTVTYDYLVQGYCHCGDASKSLMNLITMISKELKPSPRSLRMVVSFLFDEGMLEKAFSVIREMELRGWILSSTVQYRIADGLLRRNKTYEAESFLDQMAEKRLIGDNIDYNSLIKKLCCCGRLLKAVDLVNIMLRRENIPDFMAYDSLIHVFSTSGKLDQALDFHAEMLDYDIRPSDSTWDMLIQNSCKQGKTTEAEKLLDAMVQIGKVPTREMYCSIVQRYRSENNLVKASSMLQAMQQCGYNAGFNMQWSLICNLTNSDLKSGGNADARFLSNLLSESGFSQSKKPNSSSGNFRSRDIQGF
uniref:Pentatricopeptide repeat-containing protein n=2 Tax=Kalanchoe fedtschenkoi TaxID=63787 RepID=A0A7N0UYC5_KALFE